jgi:tRNA pseudouridine38-40 synthase
MYRYKLKVEYCGKGFSGWQRQSNSFSVQQAMEEAIYKAFQENVDVFCAGRTDAGVHAIGQVAHFDMSKNIESFKVQGAINYHLKPNLVCVYDVENLGQDSQFHARFSAKRRSYIYKILNRPQPPSIDYGFCWWVPIKLDVNLMNEAAQLLVGKHDFSSFRAAGCQGLSPIKSIDTISVTQNNGFIELYIEAPSFLYHQVRNIVGSLYLVGSKKITVSDFENILKAKDRKQAGQTAPAEGLYFYVVKY